MNIFHGGLQHLFYDCAIHRYMSACQMYKKSQYGGSYSQFLCLNIIAGFYTKAITSYNLLWPFKKLRINVI